MNVPVVTLGWRLRMAMEFADLKADEMASRLHVHRGTITRWTHDVGSPPRGIYLERWAELTGVPLAWLTGDLAGPTPPSPGRDTGRCSGDQQYRFDGNQVSDVEGRLQGPRAAAKMAAADLVAVA